MEINRAGKHEGSDNQIRYKQVCSEEKTKANVKIRIQSVSCKLPLHFEGQHCGSTLTCCNNFSGACLVLLSPVSRGILFIEDDSSEHGCYPICSVDVFSF